MHNDLLDFRNLALREGSALHLKLQGGDFCTVSGDAELFFDVIEGIAEPGSGTVLVEGASWQDLTPAQECHHRSKITRVHPMQEAWIRYLSVRENISLRPTHHKVAPSSETDAAIDIMAGELGVASDLEKRPEKVATASLQMCQWIRAFLGAPLIVLLSEPERGVSSVSSEVLRTWVSRFLENGGLVIWARESGAIKDLSESIKEPRASITIEDNEIILERV